MNIEIEIEICESDEQISQCYPVMKQLRTNLTKTEFLSRVKRQQKAFNYTLIRLVDENHVVAVSGVRISESLCDGKYLYVDDFVTDGNLRSKGYGGRLFNWIVDYAKSNNCNEIGLESGVQRFDAHRFYLGKRMKISSHHFCLPLK